MASLNKVQLIGNLGRDPETRTFPSGDAVCNITIATTEKWKDKQSGEPREATEWHRVMFTGRLAEVADQYLRKGAQVYVEGKLTTREWVDKDGVKRYTTEIRADQMKMLGSAPGGDQRGGGDGGRGGNDLRGGYEQRGGQQQERGGYEQRGQAPAPQQRAAPPANAYQPRNPPQARAPAQAPAPAAQGGGYAPGGSGFDDMSDDIPFATSSFEVDTDDRKSRRLGRASF